MSSDYLVPRFCSQCGSELGPAVIRHGETGWECLCGQRHHRRPTVGVAVVVLEAGRLLLVRRRYGSKAGLWCIPCGHLGWGEDVRAAAVREAREETGLVVELDGLIDVHTNFWHPERLTVGIWFAGHRTGGELLAGDDAAEVGFFDLDAPPSLAFPTDQLVIDRLRYLRAPGAGPPA